MSFRLQFLSLNKHVGLTRRANKAMFVPSSDLPQYSCLRLHLICRACFHCRLVFTRFFERCTSRFWHACDINPAPACLSTSSPPTLLHPTPFHLAGIYTIFLRVITAVTSLKDTPAIQVIHCSRQLRVICPETLLVDNLTSVSTRHLHLWRHGLWLRWTKCVSEIFHQRRR